MFETNYGEEYYEIKEFLKLTHTKEEIEGLSALKLLSTVTKFEVAKKEILNQTEMINKADIIVDNFAIYKNKKYENLVVIDLNNTENTMNFTRRLDSFSLFSSTFPEDKRKYQALYTVKCNEE